jgi:hypothetical protein
MSALLLHPAEAAVEEFVDELALAFGRTLTVYQRECLIRSLTGTVETLVEQSLASRDRHLIPT